MGNCINTLYNIESFWRDVFGIIQNSVGSNERTHFRGKHKRIENYVNSLVNHLAKLPESMYLPNKTCHYQAWHTQCLITAFHVMEQTRFFPQPSTFQSVCVCALAFRHTYGRNGILRVLNSKQINWTHLAVELVEFGHLHKRSFDERIDASAFRKFLPSKWN